MSTLTFAPAAVNVRHFRDATVLAGSPYDAEYDAILRAEATRRGLDLPGVVCTYEPSELDLALLHGDDHDAQPGSDDDVWTFSDKQWQQYQLEAEMMAEERELNSHNRAMCGYGDPICHA